MVSIVSSALVVYPETHLYLIDIAAMRSALAARPVYALMPMQYRTPLRALSYQSVQSARMMKVILCYTSIILSTVC